MIWIGFIMFENDFNFLINFDLEKYFNGKGLAKIIGCSEFSRPSYNGPNSTFEQEGHDAFGPDCLDLSRLHAVITIRKVLTVLEFGSGLSTLVMAHAVNENKSKYEKKISKIRRQNPFHIYSIETEHKYASLTLENCSEYSDRLTIINSDAIRQEYSGQVAGCHSYIPSICPDLIYIDGPSPYSYRESCNEYFSFKHPDITNITCDLLKLEPCLLPGTIVIFDGMTNNSRFNRRNLKRNWLSHEDIEKDFTILMLNETPIGIHHINQLDFINS